MTRYGVSLCAAGCLTLLGCPSDDSPPSADAGSGSTASSPVTGSSTDTAADTTGPATAGESDSSGEPPGLEPGPDVVLTAFDQAHVFFLGWEEGQNARTLDAPIEFPAEDLGYENIALYVTLACPDGGCDWWDRFGNLSVVHGLGTDEERELEIGRFITPYRVGGGWGLDVSHLRPLLTGAQTLRLHIDTWVGPGHAQGDGWLVDVRFEFFGGVPSPRPVEVIEVWPRLDFEIGCPTCDLGELMPPQTLSLPEGTQRVELVTTITGHGQGNLDNCAEFCQLEHGFLVDGQAHQRTIWRDDCDQNPISGQQGTWTLPRAGWCPGDDVTPWVQDVTPTTATRTLEVAYDLSGYTNTCHPDSMVCEGCALGTGCEFDGGNHTAPQIKMSTLAVVYAD